MEFFVYILKSDTHSKFYVGQTSNIETRIERHNKGFVKSTKSGIPWKLIELFEVESRSEAIKLERKIKGRGIKRYLNI